MASGDSGTVVAALQARVTDLEAAFGQFQSIVAHEKVFAPPPPKHLQIRVVGGYVAGFIDSGYTILDDLDAIVGVAGRRLTDFGRILDFGCGCGRMSRALKTRQPQTEVFGTDIDPEAIGWLRNNLSHLADFRVAPHRPPTDYANGFFDFIFGISVMTHLPEDLQFLWLDELRRVTAPDGLVLLTTSGEKNYSRLPPDMKRQVETAGFYFLDGTYGQSISLPDFYQNTFHSFAYIDREWSKYFDVVDKQPARVQGLQDSILLRKRR